MIKKLIASAITLVLVTTGTGNAEWLKEYTTNEFDGKGIFNMVISEDREWAFTLTKWDDGTFRSTLTKQVNDYPRRCTPDFEVLVDEMRKDSNFIVARVVRSSIYFFNGKAIKELADKHDKILFRDKEDCIDGILRFNTEGNSDFSWSEAFQ